MPAFIKSMPIGILQDVLVYFGISHPPKKFLTDIDLVKLFRFISNKTVKTCNFNHF